MSEHKSVETLNPAGYDLQFGRSGEFHYTSRNNSWTVKRLQPGLWEIRYMGKVAATSGSKAKAMAWAAGKQANILGAGN